MIRIIVLLVVLLVGIQTSSASDIPTYTRTIGTLSLTYNKLSTTSTSTSVESVELQKLRREVAGLRGELWRLEQRLNKEIYMLTITDKWLESRMKYLTDPQGFWEGNKTK